MKTSTRKLSGPAKDRFLKRFFADHPDLAPALADELARKSSSAFSSVRIRRGVFDAARATPQRPLAAAAPPKKQPLDLRPDDAPVTKGERVVPARTSRQPLPLATSAPSPAPLPPAEPATAPKTAPEGAPEGAQVGSHVGPPVTAPGPSPETAASEPSPPRMDEPFDPYSIGLVPTLQREGREGLAEKLAAITSANDLRALAKAQQIVLPRELRTGEATPETIREAIVTAVARRVDDRRSAAG